MHTRQNLSIKLNQNSFYLECPRLHTLLEDAIDYPLVTVCAGAGYGKTRTVYSFLQKRQSHTTWIQLSDRDNATARFWENIACAASQHWPEIGASLLEAGFPESEAGFAKLEAIIQGASSAFGDKHVIVFDDFHLLKNPAIIDFFERVLSSLPQAVTIILISRTMPKINIIELMMHERVFTINENNLRFTESEIAEYLKQITPDVTRQDVRDIYSDTQGWVFAVNLIGRSLHKSMKYERFALEAMKASISMLIEKELAPIIGTPLWRFLLRISLIDNLAASFIKTLDEKQFPEETLVREMERLSAFVYYDFQLGAYSIHHLFLEHLRKNQDVLTGEEKRDTYQKAAAWCDASGYHMDALLYYEKSGDYRAIVHKVAMLNMHMSEMTRCALAIFDRAPRDAAAQSPIFHAMHLKLKMSLGQFDEAWALAEQCVKDCQAQPESPEKNCALSTTYAAWGVLSMLQCTDNDRYDFDVYFQKMSEYYDKSPFESISSSSNTFLSAWASTVGTCRPGAQKEYLHAVSRAIPHVSRVLNGSLYGLDDLVRGELCFYRQELDSAGQYLKQAADKAHSRGQGVMQHQALLYLMQAALFRGDLDSAIKALQTMEAMLGERAYDARYTAMHDIACGFFHLALNQPEQIQEWLKGDFSTYAHPAFLGNHANRVKALYHYHMRQYSSLLIFIDNSLERQMILFGEIELTTLKALALYHLKRRDEAVQAFTEAYNLAQPSDITLPFVQHSNDMRALTAAALKCDKCRIPKQWLESISRKASTHAKRKSQMIAAYRLASHVEEVFSLSNRETAILRDLSKGLSRAEVATTQNISVNTVKMVINRIYNKLGVNSLAESIMVAAERKII